MSVQQQIIQSNLKQQSLKKQWDDFLIENPKKRIRDVAKSLNVSEMELLATDLTKGVWCLVGDLKLMAKEFKTLGKVFSLVRNEWAVNEKTGTFKKLAGMEHVGLFLGEMDQRLFFKQWAYGFFVNQNDKQSIQIFDRNGDAVLKLYKKDETNESVWNDLIENFKDEVIDILEFTAPEIEEKEKPVDIDAVQFSKRWAAIKDVHQYAQLLHELNMTRQQAFEKVPKEFAHRLSKEDVLPLIQDIQKQQVPVVLFVGNKGAIQIFTGKFEKIVLMDKWYNVFNKDFTLHLDSSGIDQFWLVRRPSAYGVISSVEALDKDGNTIMQIFGERAPKDLELESWREILKGFQINSVNDTQALLTDINKNNEFVTTKEVAHG
ncbi:hemin-degrading factor [Marinicellulosiphila megalodicopiae]|uniref:hemin-degrading factor n=1 Tax=Marinicellulosiphila megalodicopiae TaxID=2724896 RepID=UPI003BAF44ED